MRGGGIGLFGGKLVGLVCCVALKCLKLTIFFFWGGDFQEFMDKYLTIQFLAIPKILITLLLEYCYIVDTGS